MFWGIVFSNLGEIVLGICWTSVVFAGGWKFGRWRLRRKHDLAKVE